MNTQPVTLGLKKSFGYGDRLGLATPGHLAAHRKFNFAPIFAQQSIREMDRTQRTPEEVMRAAQEALASEKFNKPWGADADHLKTEADVQRTAAAGFCFFTIDPSAFVVNEADRMSDAELTAQVEALVKDGIFPSAAWTSWYLEKKFDVASGGLNFTRETLFRAAVKYARAIAHVEKMGGSIRAASANKPFEIEVSVDETDSPTSIVEHLFFALELRRRKVPNVVSLAPRFIGEFEKGIDFKGDLTAFEKSLAQHVEVAKAYGPYKISVHSGSDKFSVYPIVGRLCGDLLHVKTAGTSYLEALRAVCRKDKNLFAEIAAYCVGRFDTDRKSYHISTTPAQIAELATVPAAEFEKHYLDEISGRQLLHVTFGSVLTQGKRANGQSFKEAILAILKNDPALYRELLDIHFTKHLRLLNAG
ncbi:MAG TPA: tagaturonate epimerase family protein [Verrucomicrobiae bacterium]|nr:tagaturonate epimerase family protein [Verrucomicrobiae bacterium]